MNGLKHLQSLSDDQLISFGLQRHELVEQNIEYLEEMDELCPMYLEQETGRSEITQCPPIDCITCTRRWLTKEV